jgi:hypothetical protein
MPRYYFHVRRGQLTVLDHQGLELADSVDAEAEAADRAQQFANGAAMNGASMNKASASRAGGIIVADDNWQPCLNCRSKEAKGGAWD